MTIYQIFTQIYKNCGTYYPPTESTYKSENNGSIWSNNPKTTAAPNPTNETTESKSAGNKEIPNNTTSEEINQATKYNDPSNANKKGVFIDGMYYDFDENGNCTRIYKEQPTTNINDRANSFIYITYDEKGEVSELYRYIGDGEIDKDGTRKCAIYDKNGNITSYYIESDFNEKSKEPGRIEFYTEDGKIGSIDEKTFNKDGKVITKKSYNKDGKLIYEEDKNAKIGIFYSYKENGELSNKDITLYDENGRTLKAQEYDAEGKLSSDTKYEYNINGSITILENYDKNGNTKSKEVSTYDTENNILGTKTYDEEGKLSSDTKYEYNINGSITILENYDKNGNTKSKEVSTYDTENNILGTKTYDKEGKLSSDTVYKYDIDGQKVISYDKMNDIDNMCYKIFSELNNLTEEKLLTLLDEIDKLKINREEGEYRYEDTDINNLYFIMDKYGKCTNRHMLNDIAKNNQKLADLIVERVKQQELKSNEFAFKYTKYILNDMEKHPKDYAKLSVDVQRLMHRPRGPRHDDNILSLNNVLDEKTEQGNSGTCYLLSTVKAIDSKTIGRRALSSIRQDLPNGNVIITCKGNNKTYLITKEEILESNHLSRGDDDMKVWELAMDKYRRDIAYETPGKHCDNDGGRMINIFETFFGVEQDTSLDIKDFNIAAFNDNNVIYKFAILDNGNNNNENSIPQAIRSSGEKTNIYTSHAYRITRVADDRVYFTNPWDDSEELSISVEEFKNINNLDCEKFDLSVLQDVV